MVFEDVERLEGTFTGTNKERAIGILVVQSKDQFTDPAKDRAEVTKSAGYNIILTDENILYSDLTEFIESRNILDGSNNNEEWREEARRRVIELRSGFIRVEVQNTEVERETVRIRKVLLRRRNRGTFVVRFLALVFL